VILCVCRRANMVFSLKWAVVISLMAEFEFASRAWLIRFQKRLEDMMADTNLEDDGEMLRLKDAVEDALYRLENDEQEADDQPAYATKRAPSNDVRQRKFWEQQQKKRQEKMCKKDERDKKESFERAVRKLMRSLSEPSAKEEFLCYLQRLDEAYSSAKKKGDTTMMKHCELQKWDCVTRHRGEDE